MPYIKRDRRALLMRHDEPVTAGNPGDLNYQFTGLMVEYLRKHGENYQAYNDCFGALIGALMELYRRKTALYEDKKIVENGDVYS